MQAAHVHILHLTMFVVCLTPIQSCLVCLLYYCVTFVILFKQFAKKKKLSLFDFIIFQTTGVCLCYVEKHFNFNVITLNAGSRAYALQLNLFSYYIFNIFSFYFALSLSLSLSFNCTRSPSRCFFLSLYLSCLPIFRSVSYFPQFMLHV